MRFTDLMRCLLAVLALVAVAGCGRGGQDQLASEGSSSPAPTPVTTAPVAPTAEPSVEASTATVAPPRTPQPSASLGSPPTQTPSPAPAPPHGDPLTLGNDDSGRTITVAVGTVIRVRLRPELGNYLPPTSSTSAVRRESSRGGYPSDDPVDAIFTAVAPGRTDLTSTTDAQCLHSQPACMIPQKQWVVHIVVGR